MSTTERRCHLCGGRMDPGIVTYVSAHGDTVTLFENVPAAVCVQCGERAYTSAVVDTITSILDADRTPDHYISVGTHDLAKIGLTQPVHTEAT